MNQIKNYAQDRQTVFRWLGEGKTIEVDVDGWTECSEEGIMRHLLSGSNRTYRIAPAKVNIAGIWLEAPIRPVEITSGKTYWYVDVTGEVESLIYLDTYSTHRTMARNGKLFASYSAAQAMAEAIIGVMTNVED